MVLAHANTEAMGHQLQAVSAAQPAGRHAVVILDRAGWHTTPNLPQLGNVSLLPLPTGSPNSIPQNKFGSNCATGIGATDVLKVMTRLSMSGIPSPQFPAPSAHFACALGPI